jgi:hypothetical protein
VGELVRRLAAIQPAVHHRVLRDAGPVDVRLDAQRQAVPPPARAAAGSRRLGRAGGVDDPASRLRTGEAPKTDEVLARVAGTSWPG